MLEMHRIIEEAANQTVSCLAESNFADLICPPDEELTTKKISALHALKVDSVLASALKKTLTSNAGTVIFNLLELIDGVSDPAPFLGEWTGIALTNYQEQEDARFLHDEFFESFHRWKEIRGKRS